MIKKPIVKSTPDKLLEPCSVGGYFPWPSLVKTGYLGHYESCYNEEGERCCRVGDHLSPESRSELEGQ